MQRAAAHKLFNLPLDKIGENYNNKPKTSEVKLINGFKRRRHLAHTARPAHETSENGDDRISP